LDEEHETNLNNTGRKIFLGILWSTNYV